MADLSGKYTNDSDRSSSPQTETSRTSDAQHAHEHWQVRLVVGTVVSSDRRGQVRRRCVNRCSVAQWDTRTNPESPLRPEHVPRPPGLGRAQNLLQRLI